MRWALRYAVLGLALGPASLQGCDVAADSMGEAWQFSTLLTFHLASVANHFLLAAKAAPSVIRSLCFPSLPSICLAPRLLPIPKPMACEASGHIGD